MLILKVTVDSLGASNDLALGLVLGEVLGQEARVSVRVVTADHDKTVEIERLRIRQRASKLLRGLNLVTTRAYNEMQG